MSQSNRTSGRRGSSRSGGGTVTVIEARVHRSTARNAKVGGFLAGVFMVLLSASLFAQWLDSIPAAFAGLVIGACCGCIVWAAIRIWPFVRILWWWTGELASLAAILTVWVLLNKAPFLVVISTMGLLACAFVVPRVRRVMASIGWCFIVRHRLRTCFSQFIVANQSGSLPLIFAARPTPVGERVWIYLRPGLSPSDLQSRLEKIAVACHASAVLIERASSRTAGFLRVDIKRREVLGVLVGSPLTDDTEPTNTTTAAAAVDTVDELSAWARTDLSVSPVSLAPAPAVPAQVPYRPTPATSVKVPPSLNGSGEDLSDYI
jgi:hypothetical protein